MQTSLKQQQNKTAAGPKSEAIELLGSQISKLKTWIPELAQSHSATLRRHVELRDAHYSETSEEMVKNQTRQRITTKEIDAVNKRIKLYQGLEKIVRKRLEADPSLAKDPKVDRILTELLKKVIAS